MTVMNIVDGFKVQETVALCDEAFEVDSKIKYNIGKIDPKKLKNFQRLEIIKLQREKRLTLREQFELEHEDAQMDYSAERIEEEDLLTQIEHIRKNR
jgi:hypothetical protein